MPPYPPAYVTRDKQSSFGQPPPRVVQVGRRSIGRVVFSLLMTACCADDTYKSGCIVKSKTSELPRPLPPLSVFSFIMVGELDLIARVAKSALVVGTLVVHIILIALNLVGRRLHRNQPAEPFCC